MTGSSTSPRSRAGAWGHLVYPPSLRHARRHPVLSELARLEEEQWLSADEDLHRQQSRLMDILATAMSSVPWYRRRLAEVFGAETELDLPADFSAWPCLSRSDLAVARDELVSTSKSPPGLEWNHTGGSTGEPVSFLQEDAYRVANLAAAARHDRWAGWDFGRPLGLLWGADRDLAAAAGWRVRLETRWLRRQVEVDAFALSTAAMHRFSDDLRRLRPAVIRGYASALDLYARHVEVSGRPFPAPAGVISCAETLTDDTRRRLREVFACPVFDRYGSREFGLIASQCESGAYHVNSRGVLVEILDGSEPARPGDLGRVVITGLVAHAMPLVRYETGDVAVAADNSLPCPCGRGLPRIGRVHGRVSDFIVTADGRMIHGEFFTHLFYGGRHVREFEVRQGSDGHLVLSVTGEGEGLEDEVRQAADAMRRRLGPDVRLELRHVKALPLTASGKRRFVRSQLAAGYWARQGMQVDGDRP